MSAGTHLGLVGCIIAVALVPGTAVAQSVALADSALVRPVRAAVSHAGSQSDADADPVKNGVIVGALAGAAAGVGYIGVLYTRCDSSCDAPSRLPLFLAGAAMGSAIGAAVGWIVDGSIKPRPQRRVQVSGMLTPQRRAVSVALRF